MGHYRYLPPPRYERRTMRRATIIEGIYRDFASEEDLQEVDHLYTIGSKGVAIAKMIRAIRDEWIRVNTELYKLQKDMKKLQAPESPAKTEVYGDLKINYY